MWQRKALQADLGQALAAIQISISALQRFSASRPAVSLGSISYPTGSSNAGVVSFPGTSWGVTSTSRSVALASLSLAGIEQDATGDVRAVWSVGFNVSDSSSTAYGRVLYGGISNSSPLGELVQRYESAYGKIGPGLIRRSFGKPVVTQSSTSQNAWTVTGSLRTPLIAAVNPSNSSIKVRASTSSAILSLSLGGNALSNEIASRLGLLLPNGLPDICPDLSIVGALDAGEMAPEAAPLSCQLRTDFANNVLAVFASSQSGTPVPARASDLTATADCAYLVSEPVIQKTLAFCLRTGRVPQHVRDITDTQMTSAGPVTVVVRFDVDSASISLAPFDAQSPRQEDHANLRLFTHASLSSVTMPDGSPAPPELRNQITVEATADWNENLYFSNVGTPSPNPDSIVDAWFQAWRAQVSRRFSIPFEVVSRSTLLERSLNGIERILLSRQNLIF